ncbi:GNS1/SUR4 family-domain-containing protein [Dipodascopsis uninucleata]
MDSLLSSLPSCLKNSKPSIDRPFGIYLWDVFTIACTKLLGWNPSEFIFIQGAYPLSTIVPVIVTITGYYVIILGGRKIMEPYSPFKLTAIYRLHNLLLTSLSFLLLVLFIEQLFPIIYRHGVFYAICNEGSWTQPIATLYYAEFLDTVLLFLRKKPLTFLHCYHHGATAALCYSQIIGHTSVSWVVITLNLGVHVVMYWYYFLASCGIRVWWKEWVTRLQIIQFVIDLGFVYFASYTYFISTYFPHLPNFGTCAGEEFAAVYGCLIITSYLFLFIGFYINSYTKKGKKAAPAKKAVSEKAAPASSNGSDKGKSTATAAKSVKKTSKKT